MAIVKINLKKKNNIQKSPVVSKFFTFFFLLLKHKNPAEKKYANKTFLKEWLS